MKTEKVVTTEKVLMTPKQATKNILAMQRSYEDREGCENREGCKKRKGVQAAADGADDGEGCVDRDDGAARVDGADGEMKVLRPMLVVVSGIPPEDLDHALASLREIMPPELTVRAQDRTSVCIHMFLPCYRSELRSRAPDIWLDDMETIISRNCEALEIEHDKVEAFLFLHACTACNEDEDDGADSADDLHAMD